MPPWHVCQRSVSADVHMMPHLQGAPDPRVTASKEDMARAMEALRSMRATANPSLSADGVLLFVPQAVVQQQHGKSALMAAAGGGGGGGVASRCGDWDIRFRGICIDINNWQQHYTRCLQWHEYMSDHGSRKLHHLVSLKRRVLCFFQSPFVEPWFAPCSRDGPPAHGASAPGAKPRGGEGRRTRPAARPGGPAPPPSRSTRARVQTSLVDEFDEFGAELYLQDVEGK